MVRQTRGGKHLSKSTRAGLVFSVARLQSRLKKDRYSERIGVGAAVFMTALVEYMVAEVLELPRHILLAVRSDEELSKILGQVTIAQGGVVPFVHSVLEKKGKAASAAPEGDTNMSK
ncbi:hypothetical protein L596_015551 [Steinernema carpocapsae]|uniref:Histone H2A n=1 Tax=Steinernema carpocapsae TaxID=34508 RepID=A0A4V6A350_STECR|nr:hypothetical protein L596_015551 [Steinernema carpocapsae]